MTEQTTLPAALQAEAIAEIMADLVDTFEREFGGHPSENASDLAAVAAEEMLHLFVAGLRIDPEAIKQVTTGQELGLSEETLSQIVNHIRSHPGPTTPP